MSKKYARYCGRYFASVPIPRHWPVYIGGEWTAESVVEFLAGWAEIEGWSRAYDREVGRAAK